MNHTARNAALEALLHVTENEGYSNIVLDKTLREYQLDKRDSALASHIFYGVLEKKITLDFYIKSLLKHPNFALNPVVLEILRIAAYQFLFLDKIPESAIVNEAVNCAKECKKDSFAGLINGILRELIRQKDFIILPEPDGIYGLSIKFSIPEELISLWITSYGKETAIKILESFSEKSRSYVRINNLKTTVSEFSATVGAVPIPSLDFACEIVEGGNLTLFPEFADGLFHVQDLSSQYLCELIDPQENEILIDTCAAPGGKTFTLAEHMNGTGVVYSYDIYKGRVKLIRSGAYRLGLKNV
ncbi:MAG: transcription antitermination factor NusB, partial [Oscillospiraceae bacterium]